MTTGLKRRQPETLIAIWEYVRLYGRIPTARELANQLDIENEQTAYMRIKRLKNDAYLIRMDDGRWTIEEHRVVVEPETARMLLLVKSELERSPTRRLDETVVLQLATKVGIKLKTDTLMELLAQLEAVGYLSQPAAWPQCYTVGPRIDAEHEYLELLAAKLD